MSETQTASLTDFLLARIAEDEAMARAATPGPWHADADPYPEAVWSGASRSDGIAHASWERDDQTLANLTHIARHDPARVLAECEAKRRIVEWDAKQYVGYGILELLALPYADHPDYRAEWAL